MVTYQELKEKGIPLTHDEVTEFYKYEDKIYMVNKQDNSVTELEHN